jgi:peptidyl serine alpha-galactosyltransferase
VGGVIIMHIDDLKRFALLWFHKSEEVRADKEHYATNITGDIYASGWISEMYGYSFAAAEVRMPKVLLLTDNYFYLYKPPGTMQN